MRSGLRNPWRFAFDSATDDLCIGDVRQNRYEEVDRLRAGEPPAANLGWNLMEGNVRYDQAGGLPARLVAPVAVYSHADGCSITGGVVYRGHDLPQLRGRYVFGDFCSGAIWSMPASGGRFTRLGVPAVEQLSCSAWTRAASCSTRCRWPAPFSSSSPSPTAGKRYR